MNEDNVLDKETLKREIITSLLWILFLIGGVSFFGFKVLSGSFKEDKINKLTAGYLTFNYVESDTNVIKLISAMPISDKEGKRSNKKEDYFEFKIQNSSKEMVKYEILVEPFVNNFKGEYLKMYLTDDENLPLKGFREEVPTWDDLNKRGLPGSVVIYSDNLDSKEERTFRLRVWISEDYVVNDKADSFSFRINIRDINNNA